MPDYDPKITELEQELKKTKYNKATQGHIGLVKAKLALLKQKQESRIQQKVGKGVYGYSVRKSGDATILLLGFPSSGKSTLLNTLTGTKSEVAAYAFTTLTVIPGLLEYKQAKIQILDVPGIVQGAASGRGRGKEVLAVIRTTDLVLILVDSLHPEQYPALLRELWESHIRINKTRPEVFIKKKSRGGIQIGKTGPLGVDNETLARILREFKINNAEVLIRSFIEVDDFIDCIESNKKYVPAIICLSKMDLVPAATVDRLKKEINADLAVSAEQNINLAALKELIFEKLRFMRIYLKEPRTEPDMQKPLIMKQQSRVQDVCEKLHKDFVSRFKFARVWGKSVKFPGQRHMLPHTLSDGDVVEIHLK